MNNKIFIAGSGGIGKAVGLILMNADFFDTEIVLGDISPTALDEAKRFITQGVGSDKGITTLLMRNEEDQIVNYSILSECNILLDCLPGSLAPKMARLALKYKCHYANLTEYVKETEEIKQLAKGADTAFILQTGLAPGFINILACQQYNEFVSQYDVITLDSMKMKVGALSKHATSPHFYAFTWSPIGVATEYLKDAYIVRDFDKISVPALSGRENIIIAGDEYEDNFTSGGAADLPEAFVGKIKDLDYKTLRYPGHYAWVESALSTIPADQNSIKMLEKIMLNNIPSVENDVVVIYASVQGKDKNGRIRRKESSYKIYPSYVGNKKLRAIQTTTASAICEVAKILSEHDWKGPIFQSMIPPLEFLNGPFIKSVYGGYELD
jgi:saccharopine dehydrogenase-like NADP-dependent oxidoreductase